MAKTILERMQELLDTDISEAERFEIQYRIFIFAETKRVNYPLPKHLYALRKGLREACASVIIPA